MTLWQAITGKCSAVRKNSDSSISKGVTKEQKNKDIIDYHRKEKLSLNDFENTTFFPLIFYTSNFVRCYPGMHLAKCRETLWAQILTVRENPHQQGENMQSPDRKDQGWDLKSGCEATKTTQLRLSPIAKYYKLWGEIKTRLWRPIYFICRERDQTCSRAKYIISHAQILTDTRTI